MRNRSWRASSNKRHSGEIQSLYISGQKEELKFRTKTRWIEVDRQSGRGAFQPAYRRPTGTIRSANGTPVLKSTSEAYLSEPFFDVGRSNMRLVIGISKPGL